jgi:DNA modification methylase
MKPMGDLFNLEPEAPRPTGPVECLGMTFENDEKRREYFLEKLREKLKDPEFRKIEGFPIGEDEDILALSDPPYYTACPNPFIEDFIKHYGKPYDPHVAYSREPMAADVSEGKNDPIYTAHSYHTKVPYKAIMRYILHYTEPGDVVLDGFCGTGMTGVAGQFCGSRSSIEGLGYQVNKQLSISQTSIDEDGKTVWLPVSECGGRNVLLNDLSSSASYVAYNYNKHKNARLFKSQSLESLKEVIRQCGWMYATLHKPSHSDIDQALSIIRSSSPNKLLSTPNLQVGRINYVVWSDVFSCPECGGEIVFWDAAMDKQSWQVRSDFNCTHCEASIGKRSLERVFETKIDRELGSTIRQAKQIPALIHYYVGKHKNTKDPDDFDLALLRHIDTSDIPYAVPTSRMPVGDESRRNDPLGITHVHHFYTRRNLWSLAAYASLQGAKRDIVNVTSVATVITKMYRFRSQGGSLGAGGGPLSGTLYVPSLTKEIPIPKVLGEHIKKWTRVYEILDTQSPVMVSTQSSTSFPLLQSNSIDYVFTDPPFGSNFMYSELNFLWEAWLGIFTNNSQEAIECKSQQKGLLEYQELMYRCFVEYYRVLKPGRWITVEFHNSKNSVWNAIQEALQHAGFVIADVRTLDKKQGSFKQVTAAGTVKQDLIISAYKPNGGLEERFKLAAGTEDAVWDFVRTHLKQLPVFVSKNGQAEVIAERQNYLLFDRMVAFHVQRGVTVPLSAAEFYAGLEQRFPPRDGMYFLPDQAAEYDKKRMTVKEVLQLQLFVSDEASAIQWLKQQLTKKPQTFQDIHPQFMKEIGGWQKHEKALELSELLRENFLSYDGKGDVPSQIHSYLSSNFKELRNLEKDDPALKAKAKDRWYVPDPNKAGDLEKLRERALMREFEEYRESKQKRLKVFRLEAVRAGFKKAWQERDYATIIAVARKIPEKILQEDPKLLMWYDQALTRSGEE